MLRKAGNLNLNIGSANMSNTLISLLPPKEQKLLKPTPETIAAEILSANMQRDIVSLCDCMKDNNLRIK
jgi:hypothetical protein